MPRHTPGGCRDDGTSPARLAASTFVELVVTIFLLVAFAALVFPIYWGTHPASAASGLENAAQRSELSLATVLPRLCAEIQPPYWANPQTAFQKSGSECRALFLDGKQDGYLAVRKDTDSRLSLVTADLTVSIDNLPGVTVDWWEKDKRIIGITIQWRRGADTMEFHAAWGSFTL